MTQIVPENLAFFGPHFPRAKAVRKGRSSGVGAGREGSGGIGGGVLLVPLVERFQGTFF